MPDTRVTFRVQVAERVDCGADEVVQRHGQSSMRAGGAMDSDGPPASLRPKGPSWPVSRSPCTAGNDGKNRSADRDIVLGASDPPFAHSKLKLTA